MEQTTKSGAPEKTRKPEMKDLNITTGKFRIDTAKIPEWVRLSIGAAIYKAVLQDMKRPDFQEGFERWMAEKAAGAAGKASDA